MICPDKFTAIDDSMLGKSTHLLRAPGTQISIPQLRAEEINHIPDVTDFILALDTLFVLGKVNIDEITGIITYAD
jgi:hypothetical protein